VLNIILEQEQIEKLFHHVFLASGSFHPFLSWFRRSLSFI